MAAASPDIKALRQPGSVEELFLYRQYRLSMVARQPVARLCEREAGVTRREWRLLGLLALTGTVNPSTLAERAMLDRVRVSRGVSSLVAKGLVERTAAPGDRREAQLRLTSEGQSTYERLLPRIATINRELLSVLDDAELAALVGMMQRLTTRAEALARADAEAAGQNGMSSSMSSNPVDDF